MHLTNVHKINSMFSVLLHIAVLSACNPVCVLIIYSRSIYRNVVSYCKVFVYLTLAMVEGKAESVGR